MRIFDFFDHDFFDDSWFIDELLELLPQGADIADDDTDDEPDDLEQDDGDSNSEASDKCTNCEYKSVCKGDAEPLRDLNPQVEENLLNREDVDGLKRANRTLYNLAMYYKQKYEEMKNHD